MSLPAKRPPAEPSPASAAARWAAVLVFALASAWNYLDRVTISAAAPRIMAEFHLSSTDFGWLVSAFGLAYALGAPLTGWLLDRLGLELGIVLAVGMWSFSTALCGMTQSYAQLAGARIFLAIWESAGVPAAGKLNSIYLEPKDRALGAAMTQIGIGIGSVAAPLIVAYFTGWRSPFFLCAALGLGWIPVWMLVRGRVRPWQEVAPQKRAGGFEIVKDPRLAVLAVANVLWMVGYSFWSNWTTLYFVKTYHLTVAESAAYTWFPPVASMLGGFAGGWISRRAAAAGMSVVKARLFALFASALGCFASIFAPFCPTPLLALIPVSVSYFAILAGSVNIYTLPVDIWGGERAGTAIAALGLAYGLMQAALSPAIGALVDRFGFAPVCWIAAFPPFLAWLFLRHTMRGETRENQVSSLIK